VPACPEEAIFADVDVPSDWAEFTALNAEMAAQCPEINTQKDPLGGEHCEKKE
jgi:ferredoxin